MRSDARAALRDRVDADTVPVMSPQATPAIAHRCDPDHADHRRATIMRRGVARGSSTRRVGGPKKNRARMR